MTRIALLGLALLMACSDATAPQSEPSTIVFKIGPTCTGTPIYNLLIDGQTVDQRSMAAGDSATFSVEPGQHTAGAVVGGLIVTIWYPQSVTLVSKQRYVATLACG